MPSPPTPIDKAFERCRLLARLIDLEYQRARGTPTAKRYIDLGVIRQEDKIEEAREQIKQAFDELVALILFTLFAYRIIWIGLCRRL
jgi:hypothetical protein